MITTGELVDRLRVMFQDRRVEKIEVEEGRSTDSVHVHCYDNVIGFPKLMRLVDLARENPNLRLTVTRGQITGLVIEMMNFKVPHDR